MRALSTSTSKTGLPAEFGNFEITNGQEQEPAFLSNNNLDPTDGDNGKEKPRTKELPGHKPETDTKTKDVSIPDSVS